VASGFYLEISDKRTKTHYNVATIDAIITIITKASILNTIPSSHAASRTVGSCCDFAEFLRIRAVDFAFISLIECEGCVF